MDNKGLMGERRHIQATTTTNRCVRIWPVEYDGGIDMITLMFTSRVRAAMEQQGGVVVILEVIQEVKEWSTYMVSYYHTLLSRVHTCSSRSSSTSIWITCLPPGGLIIPCIILSHRFVQPIPTCWSYASAFLHVCPDAALRPLCCIHVCMYICTHGCIEIWI